MMLMIGLTKIMMIRLMTMILELMTMMMVGKDYLVESVDEDDDDDWVDD
jgi:hypothetical protein